MTRGSILSHLSRPEEEAMCYAIPVNLVIGITGDIPLCSGISGTSDKGHSAFQCTNLNTFFP